MTPLAIAGLGAPELLIILAVIVLLFGASKLPELARGSGRALRIFKAETKGLREDKDDEVPQATAEADPARHVPPSLPPGPATSAAVDPAAAEYRRDQR
jgi:sec-independent protein translocase protein TatA